MRNTVYSLISPDHALNRYTHGLDVYVSTAERTLWKLPASREYSSHAPAMELFNRSVPKFEGRVYFYKKEES